MNKFNIGDQVKVTSRGSNASTFFNPEIHSHVFGVYQFDNWRELMFEICGEPKLWIGDKHIPNELCYPISFEGKEIGYVYEPGLELMQCKKGYIYTGTDDGSFTYSKIYYLRPNKSLDSSLAFIDDNGIPNGKFENNRKYFKPVIDIAVEPKQMQLNLKIKKAILLLTDGTDMIRLVIDGRSSLPDMDCDTTVTIECQQGYGETYCNEVLSLEPEIINLRTE